jgi:Flp pilus assembly protein TadD
MPDYSKISESVSIVADRTAGIPTAASDAADSKHWPREVWPLGLVVAITVAAYWPAMQGGFIWDDDGHVTRPELQSPSGLYRIWFELGATQQYYPLLHSALWLEHQLWGDEPLGYHATSVALHCGVVLLVYAVLRRLHRPGAMLAAAIFAVHPVHVESVAWISEQKNTLSATFYLTALLAYLRFDRERNGEGRKRQVDDQARADLIAPMAAAEPAAGRGWYLLAFVLFLLGLLAKTVTATLPAALLVIFWWQRARLEWRRDVLPLLPFFAAGAAAGVLTAWVERKLIGAEGAQFDLSLVDRGLIAGRAIWFYVGKLIWPSELIFIYPRWDVDPAVWWQWMFPLTALAATIALALAAARWRGPLACWLFFVGTLFPVLGFLNVYPFIYSFVADHFQYLASLGLIVLFAAGTTRLAPQAGERMRLAAGGALVVALATLTWRQSSIYADLDALYQTTIERNTACWMAYNNLGVHAAKDRLDDAEAIDLFHRAIDLKADYADAHYNLANALARSGRHDEALAEYKRAIELKPSFAEAENNLANYLKSSGDLKEAIVHLERAVKLAPKDAEIHANLGTAHLGVGDFDSAADQARAAIRLEPNHAEWHEHLGVALARDGKMQEAAREFQETIRLDPGHAEAHSNLAKAFAALGERAEAIATAKAALELAKSNGDVDTGTEIEAWLKQYETAPAKTKPAETPPTK